MGMSACPRSAAWSPTKAKKTHKTDVEHTPTPYRSLLRLERRIKELNKDPWNDNLRAKALRGY
eukprot:2435190-Karenia_brevis.AAC.1